MFKKYTLKQLKSKYLKCCIVEERTTKFSSLQYDLMVEINKRQRALIYKVCCKVLKNDGLNQFYSAKVFTDSVMNKEIFASDDSFEISRFYTKNKAPFVVYFE
jgi:hypothetical protein